MKKKSSVKLYAVPGPEPKRRMDFVAAPSLGAAKKFHAEARPPKTEELEAAIVDLMYIPLANTRGQTEVSRPASVSDFIPSDRIPFAGSA